MIIIGLTTVVGVLLGIVIGRQSSSSSALQSPADDGKLAQSYKEKVIVKVIRDNAKDLQKCYFAHLKKAPKVTEGEMEVLIEVEENGKVSSVEVTRNEFKKEEFAECVSEKIEDYYFSPPPIGINRFISHVLAFKSEETAIREAKERAEKNKPPQMLPVNP